MAVMGDGSMMYSIQALWTAARHGVRLTVVVLNNREYGAMKEFKTLFGISAFPDVIEKSLDLPGIDLPATVEGLGVRGIRTDRTADLHEILREALKFDGPMVVDASVGPVARHRTDLVVRLSFG